MRKKSESDAFFDVPTGKVVANFDRDQLWARLTDHPLFSVALTLLALQSSLVIYRRGKSGEKLWSNAKHSPIKNPITAK